MNLATLRSRVSHVLQYSPGVEAHRIDLNAAINRSLRSIVASAPWGFSFREWNFWACPTIKFGYSDWTVANDRAITFSTIVSPDIGDITTPLARNWVMWALNGATIQPPESVRASLTAAGYGTERYTIEYASYTVAGSSTIFTIYLDPRFTLAAKTGAHTGQWTIRFEHYPVPREAGHFTDVAYASDTVSAWRPLAPWTPEDETFRLTLTPESEGPPAVWQVETAGRWGLRTGSSPSATREMGQANRVSADPVQAPVRQGSAASSAGAGTIPINVRVQWVYTWQYAGRESGPSPVIELTATTPNKGVDLTGLEKLDSANYGRIRVIYRRIGEGRWQRIGTQSDCSVSTFTDSGGYDPAYDGYAPITDAVMGDTAVPKLLRLWPRPNAMTPIQARYQAIPPLLVADTDVPEFPEEFHEVIVADVAAKELLVHGNKELGAIQEAEAEKYLRRMRAYYLNASPNLFVRGSSWNSRRQFTAIGPITWNG